MVTLVGLAVVFGGVRRAVDALDDAAAGVARDDIRVDAPLEVVRRGAGADLDAIELLAEVGVGFAAGDLRDAGEGHQVPFVGGVEEDLAAGAVAVLEDEPCEAVTLLLDLREAVFEEDRHVEVGEHRQEEPLDLGGALDLLLEEIEEDRLRHAADGLLLAVVHVAQAGGGHSADVAAEDEDGGRLAHLLRLAGGGDRRGAGAVDHDVEVVGLRLGDLRHGIIIPQPGIRVRGFREFLGDERGAEGEQEQAEGLGHGGRLELSDP